MRHFRFTLKWVPFSSTFSYSKSDPLNGYYPANYTKESADTLRIQNPELYLQETYKSIAAHVSAMLEFQKRGAIVFDYGNNLRGEAKEHGNIQNAFDFPGFVPAFIRPLFCDGKGPFRWVALSGDRSTPISKAYTYTIDTAYYENPRTLMLRNAFGLWEILVCTGTGAQENGIRSHRLFPKALGCLVRWSFEGRIFLDKPNACVVYHGYGINSCRDLRLRL